MADVGKGKTADKAEEVDKSGDKDKPLDAIALMSEKSTAASTNDKPNVSVVSGDITSQKGSLITLMNPRGDDGGKVDERISTLSGSQFIEGYRAAMDKAPAGRLTEGQAVVVDPADMKAHKGAFDKVVYVTDGVVGPQAKSVADLVVAGLRAADESGSKTALLPAMRLGVAAEAAGLAPADVARGIQEGITQFLSENPKNLKDIKIVVYNDPKFESTLKQELQKGAAESALARMKDAANKAPVESVTLEGDRVVDPEMEAYRKGNQARLDAVVKELPEALKAGEAKTVEWFGEFAKAGQMSGGLKYDTKSIIGQLEAAGYEIRKGSADYDLFNRDAHALAREMGSEVMYSLNRFGEVYRDWGRGGGLQYGFSDQVDDYKVLSQGGQIEKFVVTETKGAVSTTRPVTVWIDGTPGAEVKGTLSPNNSYRDIYDASKMAAMAAEKINGAVQFKFNDQTLIAKPGQTGEEVAKPFMDEIKRRQAEYEASPAFKAAQEAEQTRKAEDAQKFEVLQGQLRKGELSFSSADRDSLAAVVEKANRGELTGYGADLDKSMVNDAVRINTKLQEMADAAKSGTGPAITPELIKTTMAELAPGHSGASFGYLTSLVAATARKDVGQAVYEARGGQAKEYDQFVESFAKAMRPESAVKEASPDRIADREAREARQRETTQKFEALQAQLKGGDLPFSTPDRAAFAAMVDRANQGDLAGYSPDLDRKMVNQVVEINTKLQAIADAAKSGTGPALSPELLRSTVEQLAPGHSGFSFGYLTDLLAATGREDVGRAVYEAYGGKPEEHSKLVESFAKAMQADDSRAEVPSLSERLRDRWDSFKERASALTGSIVDRFRRALPDLSPDLAARAGKAYIDQAPPGEKGIRQSVVAGLKWMADHPEESPKWSRSSGRTEPANDAARQVEAAMDRAFNGHSGMSFSYARAEMLRIRSGGDNLFGQMVQKERFEQSPQLKPNDVETYAKAYLAGAKDSSDRGYRESVLAGLRYIANNPNEVPLWKQSGTADKSVFAANDAAKNVEAAMDRAYNGHSGASFGMAVRDMLAIRSAGLEAATAALAGRTPIEKPDLDLNKVDLSEFPPAERLEIAEKQAIVDKLMMELPQVAQGDAKGMIKWISDFAAPGDRHGVSYDHQEIRRQLETFAQRAGYDLSQRGNYAGRENTQSAIAEQIVRSSIGSLKSFYEMINPRLEGVYQEYEKAPVGPERTAGIREAAVEANPGDTLEEVTQRAVEAARAKNAVVTMGYGETTVRVQPDAKPEEVAKQWNIDNRKRFEAKPETADWANTAQGKEYLASRAELDKVNNKAAVERLISSLLPSALQGDAVTLGQGNAESQLANWVGALSAATQKDGAVFDPASVIQQLEAAGYRAGAEAGNPLTKTDSKVFTSWLVGQALEGLKKDGTVPQSLDKLSRDFERLFPDQAGLSQRQRVLDRLEDQTKRMGPDELKAALDTLRAAGGTERATTLNGIEHEIEWLKEMEAHPERVGSNNPEAVLRSVRFSVAFEMGVQSGEIQLIDQDKPWHERESSRPLIEHKDKISAVFEETKLMSPDQLIERMAALKDSPNEEDRRRSRNFTEELRDVKKALAGNPDPGGPKWFGGPEPALDRLRYQVAEIVGVYEGQLLAAKNKDRIAALYEETKSMSPDQLLARMAALKDSPDIDSRRQYQGIADELELVKKALAGNPEEGRGWFGGPEAGLRRLRSEVASAVGVHEGAMQKFVPGDTAQQREWQKAAEGLSIDQLQMAILPLKDSPDSRDQKTYRHLSQELEKVKNFMDGKRPDLAQEYADLGGPQEVLTDLRGMIGMKAANSPVTIDLVKARGQTVLDPLSMSHSQMTDWLKKSGLEASDPAEYARVSAQIAVLEKEESKPVAERNAKEIERSRFEINGSLGRFGMALVLISAATPTLADTLKKKKQDE